MSFTLVNKNTLIPQIEIFQNFDTSIQKLFDLAQNNNKDFCKNLYVVTLKTVYFTNGKELYIVDNTKRIRKIETNIINKSCLNSIQSFLDSTNEQVKNNQVKTNSSLFVDDKQDNDKQDDDKQDVDKQDIVEEMSIDFNAKDHKNNIMVTNNFEKVNTKEKIKEKSDEELEIMKLCEETMEIYHNEIAKIKGLEKKIKILESNELNLLKKKREKMLSSFSKFKNDYNTYKMIHNKLKKDPKMNIPSLFMLKYDYFVQLITSEENIKLLEEIDNLNLDEVLNTNYELDSKIQQFVNDYGELSKKMNVKFDHSWEELEVDADTTENNNSKLSNIR